LNEIRPYQTNTKETKPSAANQPVPLHTSATTESKEGWTVKEKVVLSLLTLVGVGGTIWLGNKLIHKAISNKEENKSFEDGSSATIAKQIKMAFDNDGWWGTNIPALREALISVESQKDWDAVVKSYAKLYNSNLLKDITDELQTTEYNEMLQIINAKPLKRGQAMPQANQYRAWAKRLKAAFDKSYGFLPGTDEAAMLATFNEMPSQRAFILTGIEYKKLYNKNLIDDIKSESEGTEYAQWMSIIIKKKKA
jgi:hypothetical protein